MHKIFARVESYREIIKGSGHRVKILGWGYFYNLHTKKHDFNQNLPRKNTIFFLLLDGSRGGDDDVDNELDYGWQEKEDPLQQELQKEKLHSQVKTEPDGGKLCYAMLYCAMHLYSIV